LDAQVAEQGGHVDEVFDLLDKELGMS